MFPAPVDPGVARPDRAVSTVVSGVDTAELGSWQGTHWYEGGGRVGEKAVERIVVYPPTEGVQTQGDPFEPVRIGFLIDMDLGQLLADCIDPYILAIEDSLNEGIFDRPVELFTVDARGLPRENFRKLIAGYRRLVDEGCCRRHRPVHRRQLRDDRAVRERGRGAGVALDGHDAAPSASTCSRSPTATSRPSP